MGFERRILRRCAVLVGGATAFAGLTALPAHAAAAPDVVTAQPVAISPDGTVVGSFILSNGDNLGGVWSRSGKLTYLPYPAGAYGDNAFGINAQDEVVGIVFYAGGKSSAATWSRTGKLTLLPGSTLGEGLGIDDCGDVVGADGTASTSGPAIWSRTGVESKLALPADSPFGEATAVNDARTVGGEVFVNGLSYEPVLWRPDGQIVNLQTPGEFNSGAVNGINASSVSVGDVAVDMPTAPEDAVRWDADGNATILGGGEGDAYAINDEGIAVGTVTDIGAVKWGASGVPTALPLPANTLAGETTALGINDAGDIVGRAESTDNDTVLVEWTASGKIITLASYPPLS